MIQFIRELEGDQEEDDGHWDDWDIPATPAGRSGPIASAPDGLDYSLTREIATLRALLTRLEASIDDPEADPERLVLPLSRLVESIARTIRIHNGVIGPPEDEWQAAVNRVFNDLGL